MPQTALKVGIALVALVATVASSGRGQQAGTTPEWAPDKNLLESLAPVEAAEGYTIRPPKGYQMLRPSPPPSIPAKVLAWAGEPRADGTRSVMTLQFVAQPSNLPLEQLADKLLGGIKRRRTNWKQGATETGTVNGMKFARIRWSGTDVAQNRNMEGFMYVAVDRSSIIQISAQDVVSDAAQTLPLTEASVLTFKKP